MFSGIVGYFDKNRTFVKLTNCEKNCHINHLLFSKHLHLCHMKYANTISAKTVKGNDSLKKINIGIYN